MFLKQPTFRSESWRKAVASLPCVLCYREGMTQAAHRNQGKGIGLKVSDAWTAALCADCHREIDQGPKMTRLERRALMDAAILLTIDQLASKGLVKA